MHAFIIILCVIIIIGGQVFIYAHNVILIADTHNYIQNMVNDRGIWNPG